mmetsp:Transcript_17178/g.44577  ORF Transcript_17178/g.44577 Transcript_17178/m.44577 type:complete len:203 (-) Transcript_17178:431-1039(-)
MEPTTGMIVSPFSNRVKYANITESATSNNSFISDAILAGFSHFGCGPGRLNFAVVHFLSHIISCKTPIIDKPRANPTRFVCGTASQVAMAVSMKPTPCLMSMSPSKFLTWPSKIKTEPPVTKPLIKDCDRKRTRYAALQRPMITSQMPEMKAKKHASSVRTWMSWKYCSWSAMRIAAMAPEEMEACGEVPSIAYTKGGTKAQ